MRDLVLMQRRSCVGSKSKYGKRIWEKMNREKLDLLVELLIEAAASKQLDIFDTRKKEFGPPGVIALIK